MAENVKEAPIVLNLSPIWKRGIARLIDIIFINLITSLPFNLIAKLFTFSTPFFGLTSRYDFSFFGVLGLFPFKFLINGVYECYFLTTSGQTIGKKALGLIVFSKEAKIIKLNKAFIRILTGVIPLEFVLCFFTAKKQCLHDILADTIVVDKLK